MVEFLDRMYQISKIANLIEESSICNSRLLRRYIPRNDRKYRFPLPRE